MARRKMDYSSYRGRKTFTDILRIIAVVLLILVVLGGGLLLFGQRYLVYRDGGVTLELPFLHREKGDSSQPELGNISIVVRPSASSSEQGEDQSEPTVDAVAVTAEELLDGTAQEKAQQAGASAIVVDMKMDSGALGWRSGEAIARNVRANSQTEQINERLTQCLNETQLHTVARLSCFKDGLVGADSGCVLRDSGGNRWKDSDGALWTTPENNAVRSYLARAAAELAAMGFDEVMLDHCGWPGDAAGETVNGKPAGDLAQRQKTMEKFLAEVADDLQPYKTELSVRCGESEANGEDELTGLTAALLERYADGLWRSDSADALPERR